MNKIQSSLIAVCTLAVLSSACLRVEVGANKKSKSQAVVATQNVDQEIGSAENKYRVISDSLVDESNILPVNHPRSQRMLESLPKSNARIDEIANNELNMEQSLVVGIPLSLIGQQSVFGGVFTKVSDGQREDLGMLKMTDLPPVHVKTRRFTDTDGKEYILLMGCGFECNERSKLENIVPLPIKGIDAEKRLAMVDLAQVGQWLSLISMMDPKGEVTKLQPLSSATTFVDHDDLSTLIFDVTTKMIPIVTKETTETPEATDAPEPKITEITTRWYLKLGSGFSPSFESRSPVEGVGFFETKRSKNVKITRFDMTEDGMTPNPIVYYGKNIPKAFRPHFAKAYANWNDKLKKILGRSSDAIVLKFLEKNDADYSRIVAGDIRYNVIEWDLENKAPYGGLGPSYANQFTGEIFAANILIQGPTIVDLYTKWFGVSERARELQESGLLAEASTLIKEFHQYADKKIAKRVAPKFSVKLGSFELNVQSQNGELEDPIYKGHFDLVPAGLSFDQYMEGYFQEMIEHELGHNLGLRHNFKGNLGANEESQEKGNVSRSIMEYLGRPYRHMNDIGAYDVMAISYGYMGVLPAHKNWFCTDPEEELNKNNISTTSAECTKSDATSDPFSFWEKRLTRSLDMLIDRQSSAAPVFELKDVESQVIELTTAFTNYALSAEKTADSWTNFFGKKDRPEKKEDVKAYVLEKIKVQICDQSIAELINAKMSDEARKIALDNYNGLVKKMVDTSTALGGFKADDLKCQ